jgi:hypothetical protein
VFWNTFLELVAEIYILFHNTKDKIIHINFPKKKFIIERFTITRSFSMGAILFIHLISVIDLYLHGFSLYFFRPIQRTIIQKEVINFLDINL